METVRYLEQSAIDRERWDKAITEASNGLIYAHSYYLDAFSGNWDALIMGDYEYVFPLPWKTRFNLRYIFHPPFTAQLGLFGASPTDALLDKFLEAIPAKFRYVDLPLNHQNCLAQKHSLSLRSNYVMGLRESYETISAGYRSNIKRNIKRSQNYGSSPTTEVEVKEVINLARLQPQQRDTTEFAFDAFEQLYNRLATLGMASCYGIRGKNNELLASAAFFYSHGRAYYILVGNSANGRTLGASHALIDSFIKDNAGRDMVLDFEGSDLRNLAFFYESFGAKNEQYSSFNQNRLPWWIRWMKK